MVFVLVTLYVAVMGNGTGSMGKLTQEELLNI